MRYGARRDANEGPIVAALRAAGAIVQPLNETDVPDLLVGYGGHWWLLEVKRPPGPRGGMKDRHLRPGQVRFKRDAEAHDLPVFVVNSAEEALNVMRDAMKETP